jgi:hypothetical protein
MCEDIVYKYFDNIEIKMKEKLLKVYEIREKLNKINLIKAFYKWKNKKYIDNNNNNNTNIKDNKTRNKSISMSHRVNDENYQTGNTKKLESYSLKKEINDLKQCTFKPDLSKTDNINSKSLIKTSRTYDIHSKLHEVNNTYLILNFISL